MIKKTELVEGYCLDCRKVRPIINRSERIMWKVIRKTEGDCEKCGDYVCVIEYV